MKKKCPGSMSNVLKYRYYQCKSASMPMQIDLEHYMKFLVMLLVKPRWRMHGCLKPEETSLMESNKISCLYPLHDSVKKGK